MKTRVKAITAGKENDLMKVTVEKILSGKSEDAGFNVKEIYIINSEGQISLKTTIEPYGLLPEVARIGYDLEVPLSYNTFSWYGRGPHESYIDRKEGAQFGLYEGTVEDQFYNYIRPQWNGNKTDIRWLALTNESAEGLKIYGKQVLETSVSRYSMMDIAEASHPYELHPRNYSVVCINFRTAPLGNAGCGPPPLEEYVLYPEPWSFEIIFDTNPERQL